MTRLAVTATLAALLVACFAASAQARAAQRWASPTGTATTGCFQADPCKLTDAIGVAGTADQIVVMPGDHHITAALTAAPGISIVGQEGQPRPRIHSGDIASPNATLFMEGGEIRDLEFVFTRTNALLIGSAHAALRVERVVIRGTGFEQTLVRLSNANAPAGGTPSVIDSSLFVVEGGSGRAIALDSSTTDALILNTTALATGTPAAPAAALYLDAEDDTSSAFVRNSLLRADWDIDVRDDTAGTSTVDIDYSAYRPGTTQGVPGAITAGPHNLTADTPLAQMIDSSGHIVAGSPLINAGVSLEPSSELDFDRQARTLGLSPDIGADEAFLPPDAVTGAASGVSATGATVGGSVRPNGLPAAYHFEYGTSPAYGSSTGDRDVGDGTAFVDVGEALGPLAPGTTYHYRLVTMNVAGTSVGEDRTFTTPAAPVPDPLPDPLPAATAGPDLINGTPLADVLCGLGGNDTINGLQGNDTLFGDACGDKRKPLSGAQVADGNDTLSGSEGNDTIYGAGGRDRLDGGAGHDRLFGGGGRDSLSGAAGRDRLDGGAGNDKLNGGASKNSYKGGSGNDSINAANGQKEIVDCGSGRKDVARVDRTDRVRRCEKVKRAR